MSDLTQHPDGRTKAQVEYNDDMTAEVSGFYWPNNKDKTHPQIVKQAQYIVDGIESQGYTITDRGGLPEGVEVSEPDESVEPSEVEWSELESAIEKQGEE